MDEYVLALESERATERLGAALGAALRPRDVVLLNGPLGAGKTTLSRAAIKRRCGVAEAPSPTFTLVETYPGADIVIWHFDFYRLENEDEAWELGVEEAFAEGASLIEWPDRAPSIIPPEALSMTMQVKGDARQANISAPLAWRERMSMIAAAFKNQSRDPSP